jgi:hypothetical protein
MKMRSVACLTMAVLFALVAIMPSAADWTLTVALFGENLTHPGLEVEFESTVRRTGEWIVGAKAGVAAYLHVRNHRAILVYGGGSCRRAHDSGWFFRSDARVGYIHTLVGGPVYERGDTGFNRSGRVGLPGFFAGCGCGFGKMLGDQAASVAAFSSLFAFAHYPVNRRVMPRVAWENGVHVGLGTDP